MTTEDVIHVLRREGRALTWREVAAALPRLPAQAVQTSYENLLRRGDLVREGEVRAGRGRALVRCRLRADGEPRQPLRARRDSNADRAELVQQMLLAWT